MANITILNVTHPLDQLTVVEFETDTGIYTRLGMPGNYTDETEIKAYISSTCKITVEQLETDCGPTEEYLANEYKYLRSPEYPPLTDLADAMYWASKGDDTKLNAYYAKCEEVKAKYPKVS